MIKKTIIIFLFTLPVICKAQNPETNCDFDNIEKYTESIPTDNRYSFTILKDKRFIEYLFEGDNLVKYETVKRIIKINDALAVNYFNKFSIPLYDVDDIYDIKVRTINKEGKIFELDKSNIKEVENLDEKGNYKKFAIDGVEVESIVEINFITKKTPRLYGSYTFQNEGYVYNAMLKVISPQHLKFDAKSYNKTFQKNDTILNGKRYLTLVCDSIEPIDDKEEYSYPDANMARIEFSYRLNTEYHKAPYYTYNLATQNIYSAFYKIDKNEKKAVQKLIEKIKIPQTSTDEKIKTIERYVKENYLIRPISNIEDGDNIKNIIKNGYSSELGITKLFANIFKYAGIEHNAVVTCDRAEKKFDKDFMTWNYLYEYLFYFPETNKLLAPASIEYRYPAIPSNFYYNNGLFLNLVSIGDMENAVHKIKQIPDHDFKESFINHYVHVEFEDDLSKVKTNMVQSFGGNAAYTIKQYYAFLPNEQKELMMKEFIKTLGDDIEIVDYKVENADINTDPFKHAFEIDANLITNSFIENAGNSYLFKIGELIGRQVELYQEHERQQPLDIDYPHILERIIKIKIPNGYKVLGAEKLKMNIQKGNTENKDDYTMGFSSDYELNKNELTVKLYEYYSIPTYPVEQYEDFRKVINAAADFTKIVIVFKK